MGIPVPLAFPPTALRGVTAGGVVGNEIGSSGTRGKVLSSAQLKAIVEASGISYLPLAGGTLTGPITGTSGLIEQRNGLTAQCLDIFETYTSGTNNGKMRFKATSSGHQIGSARATSGSNRALLLGHYNSSDVFAEALRVETDGTTLLTQNSLAALQVIGNGLSSRDSFTTQLIVRGGIALSMRNGAAEGASSQNFWASGRLGFKNTSIGVDDYPSRGSDVSFARVSNTQAAVYTTASGTTPAIWLCGQLLSVPPASVTLATNGHFSIEMASNTAGNLVYRGSDGTTRRMALTFS